jgi:hypothetical protein
MKPMLTIREIESACDAGQELDFSRHELEPTELTLTAMFYPHGFPTKVRTNSAEVLEILENHWKGYEKQYDTEPILSEVYVVEGGTVECPPAPSYRLVGSLMIGVADSENYAIVDLEQNRVRTVLSRAALRYRLYVGYCLLGMPGCIVTTRYATPIHAGCVALDGHGVLLCGDSGVGKSTLSYACARAGWTYVSDDASFLINHGNHREVVGDSHRVRFRPTAAELFPEIRGLEITPRMAGKPSIEMPTASMPHIQCSRTTQVDFMVFLNRNAEAPRELVPYRKDVARYFMRQILFGLPETRTVQYEAIERLLEVDVFELRYSDLDWAMERLRQLVREGR